MIVLKLRACHTSLKHIRIGKKGFSVPGSVSVFFACFISKIFKLNQKRSLSDISRQTHLNPFKYENSQHLLRGLVFQSATTFSRFERLFLKNTCCIAILQATVVENSILKLNITSVILCQTKYITY